MLRDIPVLCRARDENEQSVQNLAYSRPSGDRSDLRGHDDKREDWDSAALRPRDQGAGNGEVRRARRVSGQGDDVVWHQSHSGLHVNCRVD